MAFEAVPVIKDVELREALETVRAELGIDAYPLKSDAGVIEALALIEQRLVEYERVRCELRDAWVREFYTEEGAAVWIADAEKKGHSLSEQLTRLEQLRTGAFA